GQSRERVAWWWQSAFFRAADRRWKKIGIPHCNQYDGIAKANGACPASRGYRRNRPGNSTHPQSETANRSAGRLESAQARNPSPACASQEGQGSALPGSGADTEYWICRFHAERSSYSQMLAKGWRTFYHAGKCAHARSGDRRAKYRHLPHANLRRAHYGDALANPQGRSAPRKTLL